MVPPSSGPQPRRLRDVFYRADQSPFSALDSRDSTLDDGLMLKSHVLIVAVDGLRASALGAYGNTTYPTPALDRFAAESLVLDACIAPSAEVPAIYRAMWQSRHPLRAAEWRRSEAAASGESPAAPSLPRLFSDRGYRTTLVAADAEIVALAGAADFGECVRVLENGDDFAPLQTDRLSEPSKRPPTRLGRLFAAAWDVIAPPAAAGRAEMSREKRPPHFVWVHARGMYGPWDAPLALQQSLLEDGDPPPVESGPPPDVADVDDPDTAFRYGCAYAAQVMVLDACWDGLMEAVQETSGERDWLVMLLGVRGFPLGEHGRVGGVDPLLHAEQLQVPWLIRFPDGRARLARRSQLVTHLDLLPTLAAWSGGESREHEAGSGIPPSSVLRAPSSFDGMDLLSLVNSSNSRWRDVLTSVATDGNRALRTPGWSLCQNFSASERTAGPSELFVRPDDRWEANDVAARCPDVAAGLTEWIGEFSRRIGRGEPMPAVELPGELRDSIS